MRRALIASLSALAVAGSAIAIAPAAMADGPVPTTQFGMHVPAIANGEDPGVTYGAIRLWDSGVAWGQVQQKKNLYWWNGLDAAIGNANSQGAPTLYVLGSTPTWAATNTKQGKYPYKGAASMPNMKDWKKWVTAVTQRYSDSIDSYQIWNEANLTTFWEGTPKQMAQLTQQAYKIIRKNDPTAKVVAASSTVRLEKSYQKFFPAYLKELKKMNWPVDVISFHGYPSGTGTPADRAAAIELTKSDMKKANVPASKELWDTEVNYGIKGPGSVPGRQITGATAAAWTAQTYLDNLLYGVDRAYWYYWFPQNNLLGITFQNGTPGAVGYQTAENWLTGSYYSCTAGSINVCQLGDNNNPEVVVWSGKSGGTYTVPASATVQCDALNTCTPVVPGSTVTIGSMPLWFGTAAKNALNQSGQ